MEERVFKAIRKCRKDIKEITLDMSLKDDLDFDSFDMLMLINELESEFDINIDETHFNNINSVDDILNKLSGEGIC